MVFARSLIMENLRAMADVFDDSPDTISFIMETFRRPFSAMSEASLAEAHTASAFLESSAALSPMFLTACDIEEAELPKSDIALSQFAETRSIAEEADSSWVWESSIWRAAILSFRAIFEIDESNPEVSSLDFTEVISTSKLPCAISSAAEVARDILRKIEFAKTIEAINISINTPAPNASVFIYANTGAKTSD